MTMYIACNMDITHVIELIDYYFLKWRLKLLDCRIYMNKKPTTCIVMLTLIKYLIDCIYKNIRTLSYNSAAVLQWSNERTSSLHQPAHNFKTSLAGRHHFTPHLFHCAYCLTNNRRVQSFCHLWCPRCFLSCVRYYNF